MGISRTQDALLKGIRVARGATLLTLALAVGKWVIGRLSGSQAITADALHSAGDLVAIGSAWFGLSISRRPPSREFPYGFYKAETLASLAASIAIIAAGANLLVDGLKGLSIRAEIRLGYLAIVMTIISGFVSYLIARWENRVGCEINARSLVANADESRADVISSAVVFLSVVATLLGIRYVDRIVAIGMSAFVIWLGITNTKSAIFGLLDVTIEPEKEASIRERVKSVPGVLDVGMMRIRAAGPFYFGELHIKVRKSADVMRAHEVATEVEEILAREFSEIEHVTVHVEPYRQERLTVIVPVEKTDKELILSKHFGRAGYFARCIVEAGGHRIVELIENTFKRRDVRAGLAVIRDLIKGRGVDCVITNEIGEIAYHALRDAFVEVYRGTDGSLEDNLRALLKGELELLTEPTHTSEEKK